MGLLSHDFSPAPEGCDGADRRASRRVTSLIRAAKLVSGKGEFVCVVRDVSTGGVRLRCFHTIPDDPTMALELQNGDSFEIARVRGEGVEASFRFCDQQVECERLVRETWAFPRRALRVNLVIPVTLRTLTGAVPAVTRNISQQGCRLETSSPLALSQAVILESPHHAAIRAKVRWRRDGECGLVFDDTFSLADFARQVARLQCPQLMAG